MQSVSTEYYKQCSELPIKTDMNLLCMDTEFYECAETCIEMFLVLFAFSRCRYTTAAELIHYVNWIQ